MANKMTSVSQDVVINLKARSSEIENSIKSLMQKLQGTSLSDSFTKGYLSSLQKVLDKNYELKKIISDTNSVNSKTTSNWSDSYNKLATELTKIIAKIEGHPIDFNDLISFDSAQYKQLKKAFEDLSLAQKNVYNKVNISKKLSDISSKTTVPKSQGKINSAVQIGNEQEIYNLIRKETVEIQNGVDAQQKKLSILKEQVNASQQLHNLIGKDGKIDFTGLDTSTKQGQAAFSYAKQQIPSLSPNATRQQLTNAWTSKNTKALIKPEDISSKQKEIVEMEKAIGMANTRMSQLLAYRDEVIAFVQQLATDFQALTQPIASAEATLKKFEQAEINAARIDLDKISTDADEIKTSIQGAQKTTEDWTDSLVQLETRQTFFSDLQSKITQIFGLANAFQGLRRFVQESWTAIKELDAAFTEIAVVTDKTTGDLWKSFDTYNKMAQRLGVTTTDAIETSALYYQQGLDTAEVMTLTTETIKMARIANMDFATATQAMTSAIRGFKLEMSDAQTITDTYSALAAEAAVDTDQLATAISKTASIAGSAGLTLEDTSAFLTQIIETTQEAPETAGTALKTIIARFTELKKDPAVLKVDVEGEEVSANKIEEALKTANVALRDTEGNFRDLDEVFLELSSKWNSLDRNTQRYIATTAAGSRQQSRFIAMMDNYKRTMELVGIANDSAGAGAIQFAKTLDSVSARVNKLKSNFEALIGNLIENEAVKGILDVLNEGMKILVDASEKGVVAFGALIFMVGKAIKSSLSLIISQFANAEKKNEDLRAKIGKIIKTTVLYQPDLTLVNEANKQLKIDPITVGVGTTSKKIDDISGTQTYTKLQQKKIDLQNQYIKSYDNVIAKQKIYQNMLKSEAQYTLNDASGMSQAYIQNAKKAVNSAIDESRKATIKMLGPTIATTVSSGVVQGIATGAISGDWKVGLATGIISTVSSALSNPAITGTISKMFLKSGGTIGKALAGIGGKVAAAVPYVAIAAGVAAIGYGLYKWFDPVERANRELKKAEDNIDAISNSLEKTRANYLSDIATTKSISSDIENYKKLSSQTHLTASEQEDYNKIVNELAEQFPQLITGYDELGNAVIDQKANWKEILEIQKQIIAKSQGTYARDVMASAEAEETLRKEKISSVQTKMSQLELSQGGLGKSDLTKPLSEEDQRTYEALKVEQEVLEKQAVLTAQRIENAYSQVASSVVTSYNAIQTAEKDRISDEESSLLKTGIVEKLKGNEEKLKKLSEDTSEEGIKEYQEYLDGLEVKTNAFITSFQATLSTTGLDASEVANAMATKTAEDFKKYLIANGLTSGEIFDYLVGLSDEQENNIEKLLGKTKVDPEKIKEFFSNGTLIDVFNRMGETDGAAYLDGLYYALQGIDPTKQKEIAEYLSGLDLTDLDIAKEATAVLLSKYGLNTELATNIILRFVDQNGNPITSQTLLEQTGLQEYFANEENSDIGDVALQELNSTGLTLDTVKSLIEDFPELTGILREFSENVDITTEDIIELKKAIAEASNNKKSIAYFKKLSEQIEIINDASSTDYAKGASKSILKDSLGITDLKDADKFIDTYLSDIEAAANGSVEAWNRVQTAIKEAKLAEIGYGTLNIEKQESATSLLNQFTDKLDELSNGDYSADFVLNGVDYTDPLFTDIVNKLALLFGSIDKARAYLETLGGISIVPSIEQVSVAPPEGQEDRAVYQKNGGLMRVPKITYKVQKNNSYNPNAMGNLKGSDSGGGGGGDDYETKTDKYYNEINAIEKLNTELEKLAELREKGNLSPEEYRNNIDQTAKYYQELQNQLHNYNESLRKDQATLITEITELGAPDAISVKNGVLIANKDAISKLSSTTQEKIDGMIDDWEKLTKTLEENSDAWWEAKYALEELADSYRESFISTEDKIRDILIQQDQDEIDALSKKYEKMKEADEDYLEALKDNIDKRRNARDKENDYNDLAKKEKRLALLKRDTSGVYGAEILSLEEEIAQSRQDLSDKEVDDMVNSLEDQASKRAEAYDKELKELQELQNDKEKSMIEYNKEVDKIMQSGAENVLKWLQTYDKEYLTASEAAQQKYLESWKNTINEANGYVNNVANGTVITSKDAAAQKAQGVYSAITAAGYGQGAADIQSHDATGAYNWYNSYIKGRKDLSEAVKDLFWQIVILKYQWAGSSAPSFPGYSEGGIVNSTGLAMVHGTTTKPEAFLSAADTKNFQILMELLNKAVNYKGDTQSDVPNALQIGECQIIVEVGSIADDYDVEHAVEKVKQSIVDNSNYRNVNIVTRKK